MPRFRKKPIVVTAEQWSPETPVEGVEFPVPAEDLAKLAAIGERSDPAKTGLIRTLEGPFVVWPGDWIVTGVEGERWPIKPSIFEKSYEPVGEDEAAADDANVSTITVVIDSDNPDFDADAVGKAVISALKRAVRSSF